MKAAIIAVGSELLGTDRLDTNSLALAATLARHGVELVRKSAVPDDEDALVHELRAATAVAELVLVGGGLGPTRDDLTREAVARFVERSVARDPEVLRRIEERYKRYARRVPETNKQQADVIEGSMVLDNERGTAPGLRLEHKGVTLFLLPGVPRELEGLVERYLEPWLQTHGTPELAFDTVEMRVACLSESRVEELLDPLYEEAVDEGVGREAIALLARPGEIRVRLKTPSARPELHERLRLLVLELLGDAVFDPGDGRDLEQVVGDLLHERGHTLATAESCTGGWISQRVTRVAGSSAWFLGGAVTYTNELKSDLLGVDPALFDSVGAVSSEVVCAMARGARTRLGGDWALSVSGIAGPGGDVPGKPVGTVFLGLAGPEEEERWLRALFPGGRDVVRWMSTQLALDWLRRRLSGYPPPRLWVEQSDPISAEEGREASREDTR